MNRITGPNHPPPNDKLPQRPASEERGEDETAHLDQGAMTGQELEGLDKTTPDQAEASPLPEIPELPEDDGLWSSAIEEPSPLASPDLKLPSYEFTDEEVDAAPPPLSPPITEPAQPWSLVGHFMHNPNAPQADTGLQRFVVEDELDAENASPKTSDGDEELLGQADSAADPDAADFIVEEVGESFPDPEVPIVPGWNSTAPIVVYCREEVYQEMYHHALSGLPSAAGGVLPDKQAAFEVKGVLLGSALRLEQRSIVVITEALRLPVSPMDRNDQCSYGPVDDAVVRRYLLTHRSLGVVGYYHSHPDHPIFLSVFDIQTLNRRCIPDWSVAVVVQPRAHQLGFFVKQRGGDQVFVSNQKPAALVALL